LREGMNPRAETTPEIAAKKLCCRRLEKMLAIVMCSKGMA
jgi:hypothetical protein